ncbi:MAG: hypothetical protein ACD_26C00030G0003 [uncultured bacterium]|nr:MAG: hypothetical protein ACD_26C00030G0003 [uncultured bacterium]
MVLQGKYDIYDIFFTYPIITVVVYFHYHWWKNRQTTEIKEKQNLK